MFIGSHVSIRKGYLGAARTAAAVGGTAFQYFPKNPRSLTVKEFDRADAEACADFCRREGILSIAHAPYPANLAAEDPHMQEVTVQSLLNDLEIVEACGSIGLVVHFGKYKGKDPLQGYKNIIQLLNRVTAEWHGNALLLIENQAGEGTNMGKTLEELVQIRNLADHNGKIGFCLDSCHTFASGLWNGSNWAEVEARGEELGFFEHLRAVHLNDSVYPSGSARDRHASIGTGHIGEAAMRDLLCSPHVAHIPVVLETPDADSHREEIAYVRGLAGLSK